VHRGAVLDREFDHALFCVFELNMSTTRACPTFDVVDDDAMRAIAIVSEQFDDKAMSSHAAGFDLADKNSL